MCVRHFAYGIMTFVVAASLGCGSNNTESDATANNTTPANAAEDQSSDRTTPDANTTPQPSNSDNTMATDPQDDVLNTGEPDDANTATNNAPTSKPSESTEKKPVETVLASNSGHSPKAAGDTDWAAIMTADKPKWPKPRQDIAWQNNLQLAMQAAKSEGRPLLVTFRCLPCKQCSEFDADVLNGGSSLDPLLKQFVTVRLTSAEDIDMRVFPVEGFQDFDLSWWGWFLSDKAELYGIFGGKDHVSDKTRISEKALVNAMTRVLDYHYHPDRDAWGIDRNEPNLNQPLKKPTDLKAYKMWDKRTARGAKERKCLHCHQLGEVMREEAVAAGTFDKFRDTQVWPLPEQVGITLERDHGLKVTKVEARSPAAKAGLKPGDVLKVAGDQILFGQADFRGVLHRGPMGDGSIHIRWLRNGKPEEGTLDVTDGWRKLDIMKLAWRKTIADGNFGPNLGFFPLKSQPSERKRLGIPPNKMAAKAYTWNTTAPVMKAGLKRNDIIVAVNGQSPDVFGRDFLTWYRMNFEPGDDITMEVVSNNKKRKTLKFKATRVAR